MKEISDSSDAGHAARASLRPGETVVQVSLAAANSLPVSFVSASRGRATLRFLPLRMQCRSIDLQLGGLAGPLWRSGFGLALNRQFPGMFDLLFSDQARLGRLYALKPPIGEIRPGQIFELGLSLFGAATEHALVCAQAMAVLGETGLGTPRGHFIVERAGVGGGGDFLHHTQGLLSRPLPLQIAGWESAGRCVVGLCMELETPLRIKDGNHVCKTAPDFHQLVRRLQGRLAQLCEAAGEANPLPLELAARQLEGATDIGRVADSVRWVEVQRRSSRTRQTMNFGGLLGSISFSGRLTPYAGLFALGDLMQLGGKTTFGFGCLRNTFTFEHPQ